MCWKWIDQRWFFFFAWIARGRLQPGCCFFSTRTVAMWSSHMIGVQNVLTSSPAIFVQDIWDVPFRRVRYSICVIVELGTALKWLVQPPWLRTFLRDSCKFWMKEKDQRCCAYYHEFRYHFINFFVIACQILSFWKISYASFFWYF